MGRILVLMFGFVLAASVAQAAKLDLDNLEKKMVTAEIERVEKAAMKALKDSKTRVASAKKELKYAEDALKDLRERISTGKFEVNDECDNCIAVVNGSLVVPNGH